MYVCFGIYLTVRLFCVCLFVFMCTMICGILLCMCLSVPLSFAWSTSSLLPISSVFLLLMPHPPRIPSSYYTPISFICSYLLPILFLLSFQSLFILQFPAVSSFSYFLPILSFTASSSFLLPFFFIFPSSLLPYLSFTLPFLSSFSFPLSSPCSSFSFPLSSPCSSFLLTPHSILLSFFPLLPIYPPLLPLPILPSLPFASFLIFLLFPSSLLPFFPLPFHSSFSPSSLLFFCFYFLILHSFFILFSNHSSLCCLSILHFNLFSRLVLFLFYPLSPLLHSSYSFSSSLHPAAFSFRPSVHPFLQTDHADKDHASTSDLTAPSSLASAAVVMENQLMRSGLEAVLAETEAVVEGAVSSVLSGSGRSKRSATDSEKALSEAIELPPSTGNIATFAFSSDLVWLRTMKILI